MKSLATILSSGRKLPPIYNLVREINPKHSYLRKHTLKENLEGLIMYMLVQEPF